MELHFIELPKFNANKEGNAFVELLTDSDVFNNNKLTADIDMLKVWALFLKKPESLGIRKLEKRIKEVKEAKDELLEISADEKNRTLYEMREHALYDRISALSSAKKKGIELGLKKAQKEVKKAQMEKERAQMEKERAQKEREKAQMEKEKAQKEKEKAQKEKEKAQKEKEKAQKEREKALTKIENSIVKFYKKGFSIEELSDNFDLPIKEITKILEQYHL